MKHAATAVLLASFKVDLEGLLKNTEILKCESGSSKPMFPGETSQFDLDSGKAKGGSDRRLSLLYEL